jgi:O-antigen/teichoic acid export membrane protein
VTIASFADDAADPGSSERRSTAHRIARNTALQLGGELVSKLLVLALYAVMARQLGRRDFGEFAFVTSLALLLISFPGLGTDDIVARNVARDRASLGRMVWHAWALELLLGAFALAGVLAIGLIGHYSTAVRLTLGLVAVATMLEVLTTSIFAAFQGLGDLLPEAVSSTLLRLVRAGAGIAVLLAGGGLVGLGSIYVLAAVIAGGYAMRQLVRFCSLGAPRVTAAELRGLISSSLPVALRGLFETGTLSVAILILNAFKGSSATALLGAGGRLVASTAFLGAALIVSLLPFMARAARSSAQALRPVYENGLRLLVAGLLPLSTWCVLFAGLIVRVAFGSKFEAAAAVTRWIAPTILMFSLSRLSTDALVVQDRQRVIPLIALACMALDIALAMALVPSLGARAGGIAITASELAYTALAIAAVGRSTGAISWERVVGGPLIAAAGMCGIWAITGESVVGLVVTPLFYAAALYWIEGRLNPADRQLAVRWITSYIVR